MTAHELATILHRSRMRLCWGNDDAGGRQPWVGSPPGKWPGDFGYDPQPWIDIAYVQAKAVIDELDARQYLTK